MKEAEEGSELKSGLTWRALVVIIISGLIFIPTSTFLSLLTGGTLGGVAVIFMTFLVSELLSFLGQGLSKQEALMLYYGIGAVSGASWSFVGLIIYRAYFINSPFGWSFKVNGTPLALLVPVWMAPSYGSKAYELRNLFDFAFLPAILYYFTMALLSIVAEYSLAMLIAKIYVESEKLNFPFSQVDVSLVSFLTEPSTEIIGILSATLLVGLVYSAAVFLPPYLIGVTLIPIPFLDLTQTIQGILPGFIFVIPTMLSAYVGGFMVPLVPAIYVFIVATVLNIFNSLFITTFPNVFPEWKAEYFPGMGAVAISTRTFARVWFAPSLGFGIGAAIVMVFKSRKAIASLLKTLFKKETSSLGFPSNLVLIAIYLASTLSSVLLFHVLVPQVPIWVPLFASPVMSFIQAILIATTQGVVGYGVGLPGYSWHTLVYLTNYNGYAGFTAPPVIVGGASGGFAQQTKACLMTKTKPTDLVKLAVISVILSSLIGLIVVGYLWNIAPIPSTAYPSTIYSMPSTAVTDGFIITRQLRVDAPRILIPAGIVMFCLSLGELLSKFGFPWSSYGFIGGLFYGWSGALSMLVGSFIGNVLLAKVVGRERWNKIKSLIVVGEGLGEGIIVMLITIIALLAKSSWIWPW